MTNSGKTILVIDDEDTMRDAVKAVLESDGYSRLESSNGEAGLQAAIQRVPDLVLCDIEMPGLSGFYVLFMFHENPATAVVPFVFLSGKNKTTDMRKGMQLGADDFLTKPFDTKELLATVRTRLLRREQEIAHAEKKLEKLRLNISTSVADDPRGRASRMTEQDPTTNVKQAAQPPEELLEIA